MSSHPWYKSLQSNRSVQQSDINRQDSTTQLSRHSESMSISRSPISILPDEILCHIFKLACVFVPRMYHTPLTISHVCQLWYRIATNYAHLWRDINLEEATKFLLYADICAKRANNLSMNITIRCKHAEQSRHSQRVDVVSWLKSRSRTIKSIRIIHTNKSRSNYLLSILPTLSLSELERFELLGLEDVGLNLGTIADLLASTPSLRSLSLSGIEGLSPHPSLRNSADNVTHLSIGALSHIDYNSPLRVDAVLEVIACCSNLCVLECFALADEEDVTPPITTLSHLSSLVIGDGPETCRLLLYLVAPNLKSFGIVHGKVLDEREEEVVIPNLLSDGDDYEDLFAECFQTFFAASNPCITKLTWEGCVIGLELLESCSRYLENLEEVVITGIQDLSGNLFFPPRLEANRPFPHIKLLTVVECSLNLEWYNTIRILCQPSYVPSTSNRRSVIFRRCVGVSDICLEG